MPFIKQRKKPLRNHLKTLKIEAMKTRHKSTVLDKESLKQAVIKLLDWSEQGYCDFQYEQGLKYLKTYLPGRDKEDGEYHQNILASSRAFWNWWKNHWAQRDQQFIKNYTGSLVLRRVVYMEINNGKALAYDIRPNSVILQETYIPMVDSIIEKAIK